MKTDWLPPHIQSDNEQRLKAFTQGMQQITFSMDKVLGKSWNKQMKTYIIYHQVKWGVNCPDGISAAWVASKRHPNAAITGAVYQEDPLITPTSGDAVVIVDFSYPASVLNAWAEQGVKVTVIDHHKTAMEALQDLSTQITKRFDMDQCGATLTWQTFFPDEPMPVFLEYIRDRDLWNFQLEGTAEIHEAMAKVGRTFDLFDRLAQMTREELKACLVPIGEVLLLPKKRAIAAACSRYELQEVAGHKDIPVVVLNEDGSEDRLTSDICSQLYHQLPDAHFVACFTSDKTWSLRSNKHGNNTDVGAIAKANGGGGHRNAAGFKPVEA